MRVNEGPLDYLRGVRGAIKAERGKTTAARDAGVKQLQKAAQIHVNTRSESPSKKRENIAGMIDTVKDKWKTVQPNDATVDDFNRWMGKFFAKYDYKPLFGIDVNKIDNHIAQTVNRSYRNKSVTKPKKKIPANAANKSPNKKPEQSAADKVDALEKKYAEFERKTKAKQKAKKQVSKKPPRKSLDQIKKEHNMAKKYKKMLNRESQ